MSYSVTFKGSALKQIEKLPKPLGRRLFVKAQSLSANPRPPGSAKLAGAGGFWQGHSIWDFGLRILDRKKLDDAFSIQNPRSKIQNGR